MKRAITVKFVVDPEMQKELSFVNQKGKHYLQF